MNIIRRNKSFANLLMFSIILLSINQFFQLVIVDVSSTYPNQALVLGNTMTILTLSKVLVLPLSGYLVDNFDESAILKYSSIGFLVFFLGVFVLETKAFLAFDRGFLLYIYAVISGALLGLVQPTLQSLIPKLMRREHRTKSNSLFQIASQLSQFLVPTVAATLFALTTKSLYLSVIVFLAILCIGFSTKIKVEPQITNEPIDIKNTDKSGLRTLLKNKNIVILLFVTAIINFCTSGPLQVSLPIFLSKINGNNASLFGYILSVYAFGSFIGSSLSLSISEKIESLKSLLILLLGFGVVWMFCLRSPSIPVLLLLFFVSGLFMGLINVLFMTMLQFYTPTSMIGRATSIQFLFSSVLTPLSYFLIGKFMTILSPTMIFQVSGLVLVAASIICLLVTRRIN